VSTPGPTRILAGVAAAAVVAALAIAPAGAGAASPICGGTPPPPPPDCYTAFGSNGTGPNNFTDPLGLAVDQKGVVYVADSGNSRIEKIAFSNIGGVITGSFIGTIGPTVSGGTNLSTPFGVAVDNPKVQTDDPNIYVADPGPDKVQKLAPNGSLLLDFGVFGNPIGVDVDATGHVYVTDNATSKDIVAKFAPDGTLLNVFGKPGGGSGNGPGQFDNPQDVSTDPSGDIYVADGNNNRMQRLDPTGAFISQTTGLSDPAGLSQALELTGPTTLVHRTWITASGSNQFFKLDANGNIIQTEGGTGTAVGQFTDPYGLAVDCDGNVFVADASNDRVQRLGDLNTPPCTPPTNTRSPQIAGQPTVGSGLALDDGDWTGSPNPELTYRWQRCSSDKAASCGDIAGQRGLTYTITNADRGFRIRAVVVGANVDGIVAEATDMTAQIPTQPITPLPPAPPPNPPTTLGGSPNTSLPTVTQTGFASFTVNCPVTGATSCNVLGDLVAQTKRGFITLASVTGQVPFSNSQSFTLQLTKRGRKLLARGLRAQAVLRVTVDNQQLLTVPLRVNRGTIKRIRSGR
jgi:sugar lactone lactonase YvrE